MAITQVVIRLDDRDRHATGCRCGRCDRSGTSYGAGIYRAGTRRREELLDRCYAPQPADALSKARRTCRTNGWRVVRGAPT